MPSFAEKLQADADQECDRILGLSDEEFHAEMLAEYGSEAAVQKVASMTQALAESALAKHRRQ